MVQDSVVYIRGTFDAGNQSALTNLTNVEGELYLGSAQNIHATPVGGSFTIGTAGNVNVDNAALHINGQLDNFGVLADQSGGATQFGVTGLLTNEVGATFTNNDDHVGFGSLSNQGTVINWGTINLTNQPNGITDVVAGSEFRNYGTVMAGANDGFGQLQSIEGRLLIENGRANSITPTNGTLSVASPGYFEINWSFRPGTSLQINGDLNNAGWVNNEGAFVTVTGVLTNNNRLDVFGNGLPGQNQLIVMGNLVNTGHITVDYDPTVTTPFLINSGRIDVDKQSGLIVGSGASGLGYVQYADGALEDVISGPNLHRTDIVLEGGATLDGTLNVPA